MGLGEIFLCNLATSKSKAIIVADNVVVGHLSFGIQNDSMKEFFLSHIDDFDVGR
ncbi:hypothetical protein [Treponema brennaborense]|uniref:hypothetical protein n=1 Tax=Treponema brennaborense TaxID=81028 RepID=UPI0012EA5EDC|nr:hypothetical protein [Treponema brennaborense]